VLGIFGGLLFRNLVAWANGAWYTPQQLAAFLAENVVVADGDIEGLRAAIDTGRGVLLATCHFGAVELIGPALMIRGLPVTGVLRFATDAFSRVVQGRAAELAASGLFGRARFIEIGRPGVAAAVEMAAVLRRREVLLAVFDEETDYSIPVHLLGAQVRGGAGLDRLLRFVNAPVSAMTAFMVRNGDGTYRLAVDAAPDGSVQGMFGRLEAAVREHPEQWYFLHEEVPFAR
jgi:lauroyl/myristoyl acyltransferase